MAYPNSKRLASLGMLAFQAGPTLLRPMLKALVANSRLVSMSNTYPFKFIEHLLKKYELSSEKQLINKININNEIKMELVNYLSKFRKLHTIDSVDDGMFCIENNKAGSDSNYKYQENGVIYDKKNFDTYGECLIHAEKLMRNRYYRPFLSHIIGKYDLKDREGFINLLRNNPELKKAIINHLHKSHGIDTELKTYDGRYCLSDYPSKGIFSFVIQERGSIYPEDVLQFSSKEECLAYALMGNAKIDCWVLNN